MFSTHNLAAVFTLLQFCGSSDYSRETVTGFSCSDYQIMFDVEMEIASECTQDVDCVQLLYLEEGVCASYSVIAHEEYDPTYLFELYDEAILHGCNLVHTINSDCSLNGVACRQGRCRWE